MTAAELPWDLCVARVVEPRRHDVLIEVTWPAVTALEIDVPVDLGTQLHRARAKQIEAMRDHLVCLRSELYRGRNERLR